MYLGWYDDNPKKTTAAKIVEAMQHYKERWGIEPNLVLVNEQEQATVPGVEVVVKPFIRRFNYWVGLKETTAQP